MFVAVVARLRSVAPGVLKEAATTIKEAPTTIKEAATTIKDVFRPDPVAIGAHFAMAITCFAITIVSVHRDRLTVSPVGDGMRRPLPAGYKAQY